MHGLKQFTMKQFTSSHSSLVLRYTWNIMPWQVTCRDFLVCDAIAPARVVLHVLELSVYLFLI